MEKTFHDRCREAAWDMFNRDYRDLDDDEAAIVSKTVRRREDNFWNYYDCD